MYDKIHYKLKKKKKEICAYLYVLSSVIQNSQKLEVTKRISTDKVVKQNVVYTHTGTLFSLKNGSFSHMLQHE